MTPIAGTGAVNTSGTNVGTTSGGAPGAGTLGTGTGVTGAGSADTIGNVGVGQDPAEGRLAPEGASLSDRGATPQAGAGLGPDGSSGAARQEVGEGDVRLGRADNQDLPMWSGPGSAGMHRTNPGFTGRAGSRAGTGSVGHGTGEIGGLGETGTSSGGTEHLRDPAESGRRNPMNEVTPDDRGGGIGMSGAGTGTPETQDVEVWDSTQH